MIGRGPTIPSPSSVGFPVGPSKTQVKLLGLLVDNLEAVVSADLGQSLEAHKAGMDNLV